MTTMPQMPQRLAHLLKARNQAAQWESFIASMLTKLELSEEELALATKHYQQLATHIARKLGVGENDVHVIVQGSMRTQTTISPRGRQNFDLDIVVKLTGPRFENLQESEAFFAEFGEALHGVADAGDPEPKRRCWRLNYPNLPFYFDVTPAVPDNRLITGTKIRVRDPDTVWSPSNPQDFADWFCNIAGLRFPFQRVQRHLTMDATTQVDPVPNSPVRLDDILRRTVQLVKLHRDNYYWELAPQRKELAPISVILVTLLASAYLRLAQTRPNDFSSAIEVALELVEQIPGGLLPQGAAICVPNPRHPAENFADRWNKDGGKRAAEFRTWYTALQRDLEGLFSEDYDKKTELRIRNVFGQIGADAWKKSLGTHTPLQGLLASLPATKRSNPSSPLPAGSRNTLG
ncbi:nucleotidyltransferase domain-containing protein [Noviherbaspirillum pedocola]|uniref:Nucleotidyltransferase n=1 Tax=Noviherbaspirillum pedocola TaxID=2801341 RepID=A0A934SSJ8_9BURK|nr:nucleotidyltransferase [Noviherbaspirillum pedocola]MBK4734690.1 nucleotidyltransferase [Noviherbaspirillum pedocola]